MSTAPHPTLEIRPISAADDASIKQIIQHVGREFGAIGEGFGPSDPEVEQMSKHYDPRQGSQYWVAVLNGSVIGGGGIASFNASDSICELKKLFLLPESRGVGAGKALTQTCLEFAKQAGYRQCYLDTLASMQSAIALYRHFGFEQLSEPMAGTEHNGCDVWMLKTL